MVPMSDATETETAQDPERVAHVRRALIAAGGYSTYEDLVAASCWRSVKEAVDAGAAVRGARGMYALPSDLGSSAVHDAFDPEARAAALAERVGAHRRLGHEQRVVLSHRSAAEFHGISLLSDPTRPEVTVRHGRGNGSALNRLAQVYRRRLEAADHADGVTTPLRTVLDCAIDLPFAEALAVADAALRSDGESPGLVGPTELREAAELTAKHVRTRVRRIAEVADGRAANPFESALRALALDIPGLSVEPQAEIAVSLGSGALGSSGTGSDEDDQVYRVDLADRRLGIVIEADSYTWHGTKEGFVRDCWRYSALIAEGWAVLRLSWDAVRSHPEAVRQLLALLVQVRTRELCCEACGHVRTLFPRAA